MSTAARKRVRSTRGTTLDLPPGRFARVIAQLKRREVLVRLGLCILAVTVIWALVKAWEPPFEYREGYIPPRAITAMIAFRRPDPLGTAESQRRAAAQARFVFSQDPAPLIQIRAELANDLVAVTSAATFSDVDKAVWSKFLPLATEGQTSPPTEQPDEAFERFRQALMMFGDMTKVGLAIAEAMSAFEQHGLLDKFQETEANQKEILVYPAGHPEKRPDPVQISEVLIGNVTGNTGMLKQRLSARFSSPIVADHIFYWLRSKLVSTLTLDKDRTEQSREEARKVAPEQFTHYVAGDRLVPAGKALTPEEVALLKAEHSEYLAQLSPRHKLDRGLAVFDMILAMCALCGYYIYHHDRRLLSELRRFVILLCGVVITVLLARWLYVDPYRAEIIPLLLFGMTFAIAYNRELALVLSLCVTIVFVMCSGHSLGEFIVLMGTEAAAILLLGRIRTRGKLMRVGFLAGVVSLFLTIGVGVLEDQPLEMPLLTHFIDLPLLQQALRTAACTLAAGFLMTGFLPSIENLFGVLTEISLLEWGDVSRPLLQELVRRAPGTYNHSINVASIAEAAAESVGAKGLLVRVGAYFHDIGKMLKPDYFVENQSRDENRHDTLEPALSTLIIIAHIKDGADLARQHRLPEPIIDFIQQHHGTTLVEYFFRRANRQSEENPDASDVEESSFRYPGPKPQTIEAAVLMLADASESASRTLVDPTPARIEGLVEDIATKRLLDGQFDECGLTLKQLRTIEDSIIKSLTAVYHGRVKYPDQRTA